jgi:3-methylcrotonyl-CoA carboxylase alpha subunit
VIESLLIANRGEIARRIIRTARRLKLRTVAVYSEADSEMPFVREADEAVCIGPAAARDSYLRQDRILDAAKQTGAEAIHPGYGFLSENAEFAEAVIGAGLVWIGAPPAAIRAMGLKDAAKALMSAAGVPVTPGYLGEDQSEARLQKEAEAIGYPVLIKAVAGGGGKGMRRVDRKEDFPAALASCRREAAAAFGNDRMLIEKYVQSPRHIEVQIFGDSFGNVVHLFERDCSLQRRHQKVVEEAPAPGMDAATREAICRAAVKAARAVDYVGAGTVEFIADASQGLRADRVWFMEMNTRLQVEHPVTEAITGQDLVEWQIRVASGEPLPLKQDELSINGSAMEARLYAENPANGFLPSTGPLEHFSLPDGLRIDSGVRQGDEITPHYDPMIAKIISHAPSRDEAARELADGMAQVQIAPVKTNAAFLARTLRHPAFLAGEVDTGFIERHLPDLISIDEPATPMAPKTNDPWEALTGFRINAEPVRTAAALRRADSAVAGTADGAILAPMPGIVIAVPVAQGDKVKRGQPLVVIEAMKMEQTLSAPFDGFVAEITVSEGMQIAEGSLLIRVEGAR